MILAFESDGVLRVFASVADAVMDVEPLDAEETFKFIFDDTGEIYSIRWIKANRWRWFIVSNGEYTLIPDNRKDVEGLLHALDNAKIVEPESAKPAVRELQRRFRE